MLLLYSSSPSLALSLLHNKAVESPASVLPPSLLTAHVSPYDIKRLELYSNNMADHHLVTDLLPALAKLVITKQLGDVHLSAVQLAILVGLGLQHKTVDDLVKELELPSSQLLALFNRSVRKLSALLRGILESGIEKTLNEARDEKLGQKQASLPSLGEELSEAAKVIDEKQKESFVNQNLSQYVIKGSESDWNQVLKGTKSSGLVSLKTGEKRPVEEAESTEPAKKHKKKRPVE